MRSKYFLPLILMLLTLSPAAHAQWETLASCTARTLGNGNTLGAFVPARARVTTTLQVYSGDSLYRELIVLNFRHLGVTYRISVEILLNRDEFLFKNGLFQIEIKPSETGTGDRGLLLSSIADGPCMGVYKFPLDEEITWGNELRFP